MPRGAHQKYIERESACVASFGTLADTYAERERIWAAIGERSHGKRGTVQIDFTDNPDLAARVMEHIPQWVEDDLLTEAAARAVAARARRTMQGPGEPAGAEQEDEEEAKPQRALRHRAVRRTDRKIPKDSLTLWTGNVDTHSSALQELSQWMDDDERTAHVKVRKPRTPIVQRRLILELAHEIDDDARERTLRRFCERVLGAADVAWHGCVHTPENDNDARNFHAHIVYTQFAPEREEHRARWTFEDENSVPKPVEMIKTLSSNDKDKGRMGRNELIREWRDAWAEIQNEELAAVGAKKVYDPRSYRDQGRADVTPGQHRGTVQSAIECRGGVATTTPSSSEANWDQLASALASALDVEAAPDDARPWAERLPEPVRDAFESARLSSGLEGRDEELRHALVSRIDELSVRENAPPTERERAAADWIRSLRDASEDARVPEDNQDVLRWERIERTVLDESERARRAHAIVAAWDDAERRDTDHDPRPKVRRLRAAARHSELTQRRWRVHLGALRARADPATLDADAIDAMLDDLRESGVSVIAAFGREEARRLAGERALSRTERGLREIAQQLRMGEPNERCSNALLSLRETNTRTLRAVPEEDHDALTERIDTLSHAIALRAQIARAATSEAPRAMMTTAQDISTLANAEPGPNITAGDIARHRAALGFLPKSERDDITRAARDAATVLAAHRAKARLAAEVRKRLGTAEQRRDDPARIDDLALDEAMRNELARTTPALAREVDQQVLALSRRRLALHNAVHEAEQSAEKKPQLPGEGLERLSHADAAELLGADPALLAHSHPDTHATLKEHTQYHTRTTARAIAKILKEEGDEGQRSNLRIARLCTVNQRRAMRAALAKDNETLRTVDNATAEERLTTQRLRIQIRTLTESFALDTDTSGDDAAIRARRERLAPILEITPAKRREHIHALLSDPLTVERLSRPEWMLAARRAGLFGAPRPPPTAERLR